jgi:dCMP deaminase
MENDEKQNECMFLIGGPPMNITNTQDSSMNYLNAAAESRRQAAERQIKWDNRYLALAKFVAQWSKDPSTQTGAVIADHQGYVVALGYNGFARGVQDTKERLDDRETKYKMVVHCERNAIISAKRDLTGYTLYTWPFMSCGPCAGMVIQAGIRRCVAPHNDNPRWQADFALTEQMFKEANVELVLTALE